VDGARCELPAGHLSMHEHGGIPFLVPEENEPESERYEMSEQMRAALLRAALTAIPTAVLAAVGVWATSDSFKAVAVAFITALVTPFVTRGVGEGSYDAGRADMGDVRASDVTPLPPVRVARGGGVDRPEARG
jgi:hypothetical protein